MIVETLIQKYGAKFITGESTQTLAEVLDSPLTPPVFGSTYLVVSGETDYRVARFNVLEATLQEFGLATLMRPLRDLPIPAAARVLPMSTPETPGAVEGWLRQNPDHPLVVTDASAVHSVLVNANLAGFVEGSSLWRLYSRHAPSLRGEALLKAIAPQYIVKCKKCAQEVAYMYQPGSRKMTCPNCGYEVKW